MTKYKRIPLPRETRIVDVYQIISVVSQGNGLSILTLENGQNVALDGNYSEYVGQFFVVDDVACFYDGQIKDSTELNKCFERAE